MYKIHDNGGRPYSVEVKGNNVNVYKNIYSEKCYSSDENEDYASDDEYDLKLEFLKSFETKNVFIGEDNKSFDTDFRGNTILLDMGDNSYVYIQRDISEFKSLSKIVSYFSPIGNSDVPYPYAIDELGNYYLLSENVILLKGDNPYFITTPPDEEDPYEFYYREEFKYKDIALYYKGNLLRLDLTKDSSIFYDELTKDGNIIYIGENMGQLLEHKLTSYISFDDMKKIGKLKKCSKEDYINFVNDVSSHYKVRKITSIIEMNVLYKD